MGEWDHGRLQALLVLVLARFEKRLGARVATDVRLQVKPTRFRVPDVCLVLGPGTQEQILTTPPFLCIEILSPEDRMGRMQERIADYVEMGVPFVWVVNPQTQKGWIYTADGAREAKDGVLRTTNPEIAVPLADLFAEM